MVWPPCDDLGDSSGLEGSIPSRRSRHHGLASAASVRTRGRRSLRRRRERPPDTHRSQGCTASKSARVRRNDGRIPPGVVGHHRCDHRRTAGRHRRDRPPTPRALPPRGEHRPRGLHRDGGGLRHRRVGLRRRPVRHRVLRRLADRVLPVGRQPVHLPDHHEQVRRTQGAAAERAARRHRARPDHARHLHRGRRSGDQQLQLDLLHLRPVPDLDGVEAREGGRRGRGRLRGEPPDQVRRAQVPGDLGVARHQDLRHRERQAA